MPIRCYLAMTEAEIRRCASLPPRIAYLSCCFSPYGLGVTAVPEHLPPGSVLLLTDRIEPAHHDPVLIARQMHSAAARLRARAVVLDLQRPEIRGGREIVRALLHGSPCPVVVSSRYAGGLSCPVLLNVPVGTPLEDALVPWRGRDVWLEMGMGRAQVELTQQGYTRRELEDLEAGPADLEDKDLCCRYRMALQQDKAQFYLYETGITWRDKLRKAAELGVENAIGLYQEFGPGL